MGEFVENSFVNALDTSIDPHKLTLIRPRDEFFCEVCKCRRPGVQFFTPMSKKEQDEWLIRLNLPSERTNTLRFRMEIRAVVLCGLHFPPDAAEDGLNLSAPLDMTIEENQKLHKDMEQGVVLVSAGGGKRINFQDRPAEPQETIAIRTSMRGRPRQVQPRRDRHQTRTSHPPQMAPGSHRKDTNVVRSGMTGTGFVRAPISSLYENTVESQYVISLLHLAEVSSVSMDCSLLDYGRRMPIIHLRHENEMSSSELHTPFVCLACSAPRIGPRFKMPPGKRRLDWINRLAPARREWILPLAKRDGYLCGLHFDPAMTLGSHEMNPIEPMDMRVAEHRRIFRDVYEGDLKVMTSRGHILKAISFFIHSPDEKPPSRRRRLEEVLELVGGITEDKKPASCQTFETVNETVDFVATEAEQYVEAEEIIGSDDVATAVVLENADGPEIIIQEDHADPDASYVVIEGEDGVQYITQGVLEQNDYIDSHDISNQADQDPVMQQQQPNLLSSQSTYEAFASRLAERVREAEHQKSAEDCMIYPTTRKDQDNIFFQEVIPSKTLAQQSGDSVNTEEDSENSDDDVELDIEEVDENDVIDRNLRWERSCSEGVGSSLISMVPDRLPKKYAVRYHRCMICGEKRVNVDLQSVSAKKDRRERMWRNLQYQIDPDLQEEIETKADKGQSIPVCQEHFPLEMRLDRLRHIELAIFPNGRKDLKCEMCGIRGSASRFCQMMKDGQSLQRVFLRNSVSRLQQDRLRAKVMNNELTLICAEHYDITIRPNVLLDFDIEDDLFEVKRLPGGRSKKGYGRQTVHCSLCGEAVARPETRKMPSHPLALQVLFEYANVPERHRLRLQEEANRSHLPVCKEHFPAPMRELRGRYWFREFEKAGFLDCSEPERSSFDVLQSEPSTSSMRGDEQVERPTQLDPSKIKFAKEDVSGVGTSFAVEADAEEDEEDDEIHIPPGHVLVQDELGQFLIMSEEDAAETQLHVLSVDGEAVGDDLTLKTGDEPEVKRARRE